MNMCGAPYLIELCYQDDIITDASISIFNRPQVHGNYI